MSDPRIPAYNPLTANNMQFNQFGNAPGNYAKQTYNLPPSNKEDGEIMRQNAQRAGQPVQQSAYNSWASKNPFGFSMTGNSFAPWPQQQGQQQPQYPGLPQEQEEEPQQGAGDGNFAFNNYWTNAIRTGFNNRYKSVTPDNAQKEYLRNKEQEHAEEQKKRADWQIQQGKRNPYSIAAEEAALKASSAQAQKVASHGPQSGAAAAFDRDIVEPDVQKQRDFAAERFREGTEEKAKAEALERQAIGTEADRLNQNAKQAQSDQWNEEAARIAKGGPAEWGEEQGGGEKKEEPPDAPPDDPPPEPPPGPTPNPTPSPEPKQEPVDPGNGGGNGETPNNGGEAPSNTVTESSARVNRLLEGATAAPEIIDEYRNKFMDLMRKRNADPNFDSKFVEWDRLANEANEKLKFVGQPPITTSATSSNPYGVTGEGQNYSESQQYQRKEQAPSSVPGNKQPTPTEAEGGYTGKGGKYEPAGVVHKGEYVVPKKDVDQTTGLPKKSFIRNILKGIGAVDGPDEHDTPVGYAEAGADKQEQLRKTIMKNMGDVTGGLLKKQEPEKPQEPEPQEPEPQEPEPEPEPEPKQIIPNDNTTTEQELLQSAKIRVDARKHPYTPDQNDPMQVLQKTVDPSDAEQLLKKLHDDEYQDVLYTAYNSGSQPPNNIPPAQNKLKPSKGNTAVTNTADTGLSDDEQQKLTEFAERLKKLREEKKDTPRKAWDTSPLSYGVAELSSGLGHAAGAMFKGVGNIAGAGAKGLGALIGAGARALGSLPAAMDTTSEAQKSAFGGTASGSAAKMGAALGQAFGTGADVAGQTVGEGLGAVGTMASDVSTSLGDTAANISDIIGDTVHNYAQEVNDTQKLEDLQDLLLNRIHEHIPEFKALGLPVNDPRIWDFLRVMLNADANMYLSNNRVQQSRLKQQLQSRR